MSIPLPVAADGATAVEVARRCAATATALIRQYFRRVTIGHKGDRNIVTEADLAVEAAVMAILREAFPGHAILSEETASDTWSDDWLWVCDPVDGTKNFAQGIPHFAFSLALCHGGEPVLGLTVHPLLGWEFLAIAGAGATFNGDPARVSARATLGESVVGLDLGYDPDAGAGQLALAETLWPRVQGLRVSGSAALGFAYAAAGLWDVYVHANLCAWDIAAGIVLVREAGGAVTDLAGGPAELASPAAVAGAAGPHAGLVALMRDRPARPSRA